MHKKEAVKSIRWDRKSSDSIYLTSTYLTLTMSGRIKDEERSDLRPFSTKTPAQLIRAQSCK